MKGRIFTNMTREINMENSNRYKFRAWDKRTGKLYEWDNMVNDYVGVEHLDKITALTNTEEIELMQYTGLKDKNGKEIAQGDVCKIEMFLNRVVPETFICEVIKKNGAFCFKEINLYFPDWVNNNEKAVKGEKHPISVEIISNNYEIPELIK